jgi:hypothetical protein
LNGHHTAANCQLHTDLAHDLEESLLALKQLLLAVRQAPQVNLHLALKECRVNCHRALVDGDLVLWVFAVVNGLRVERLMGCVCQSVSSSGLAEQDSKIMQHRVFRVVISILIERTSGCVSSTQAVMLRCVQSLSLMDFCW